ncbi:hypothetical protein H920_07893 [Fukomys damarensis]|uniref:Uncharacterized protein n=1 Tax=Fukomys damarensis TaxID=885580 RepID=A0A091DKK0_FUKDA|nr:hypothetical protein H920_07893 [Fukomys damarensis]
MPPEETGAVSFTEGDSTGRKGRVKKREETVREGRQSKCSEKGQLGQEGEKSQEENKSVSLESPADKPLKISLEDNRFQVLLEAHSTLDVKSKEYRLNRYQQHTEIIQKMS